jgi:hypothetical protein
MTQIDVTEIHNELLEVNAKYREALNNLGLIREEDLEESFNMLVNKYLKDSNRKFEIFTMELFYVAHLNGTNIVEGIVDMENDTAFLTATDTGFTILSDNLSVQINWSDIRYAIVSGKDMIMFDLFNGEKVYVGVSRAADIFPDLLTSYKRNFNAPFIVAEEIIPTV